MLFTESGYYDGMPKSLNSSDEVIEQASEVTPTDIERAKETARQHGQGTDLNRMLEATVEEIQQEDA